ncbi:Hypothetical protein VC0266 (sugar utilization related?) [hydrothermal vent metagenome]|uniref:Uracil-DNA glycosylase-like domain-containing protein n=1 Tax=hydrothermal vent metagenome TaxID=652676 RepID=A0A3B1A9R8_9ZZZZ
MIGTPVVGNPSVSPIMLIGQAPGIKEVDIKKPFAWTAGKTLFKWFNEIGLDETEFRQQVYMAAVCRCFPGKLAKGGDRVPDKNEIDNCSHWLQRELDILQPQLIIPVGKLAISQFLAVDKLVEVIGKKNKITINNRSFDCIPLPHPSGASTWHRKQPGIALLKKAQALIKRHPAWKSIINQSINA